MRIIIAFSTIFISIFGNGQGTEWTLRVDSIVEQYKGSLAPGLSIGIVENGKLVYSRGVGLANMNTGTLNADSTIFGIASVAKQFTAACIWSLIRENRISLDDDIREYLPEFPKYGETIRIRHVLNHTSGIRNYHAIMELAGFDYDTEYYDNQSVLDLACSQRGLNNSPGEKVIYGNTGYTLLAMIIERISGQNMAEYAEKNIFTPLGMMHSFYRVDTTIYIPNRALGYVDDVDQTYMHVTSNQLSYGAGSVGSSVEDLTIWSNVLNGLNTDYLDLTKFLTTPEVLSTGETAKYARGVMVDEYRGVHTIHHSGYGLGGQAQIIAIPKLKMAVIVLTNLQSIDPSPLSYQVMDLFLSQEEAEDVSALPPFRHKRRDLKQFVGQYRELNSDMKMEVTVENDTLKSLINQGKRSIALLAISRGKFERLNNASVEYDFFPAKKMGCGLIVYFGGTPFYFSRATFIDPSTIHLNDYTGKYFSEELSIEYDIFVEEGQLLVNYPNHPNKKLYPGQRDEFGNGNRVLYHFERNRSNEVVKLYLSAEGSVKDIQFNRR